MTDKSFGDHLNRNVVKNPLLSTAVTGLSIEDLTHNAVLLPVAVSQELISEQDKKCGPHSTTLPYTDHKKDNVPSGDANSNTIVTDARPTSEPNYFDDHRFKNILSDIQLTQSNALTKSDDDFDVNEYFARLHGTRYVSAPLNTILNEKQPIEASEENLEEINLNEPDKAQHEQSLTADIAQNFSQLPSVLPHVASAVFSSFSNMLSMKSREQTPDEARPKNLDYQEVQFQRPEVAAVPMMAEAPSAPKELGPPPAQPPIGGTTNFRITTKKKGYAQIPGLSSTQPPAFCPQMVAAHHANNIPHQVILQYAQNKEENIDGQIKAMPDQINAGSNIFNPTASVLDMSIDVESKHNENKALNTLNDIPASTAIQPDIMLEQPVNVFKPVERHEQIAQISSTPIIPPPPMFSNLPRRGSQNNAKSVLPPSVARRIDANHPIIKQQTAITPVQKDNIFTPSFDHYSTNNTKEDSRNLIKTDMKTAPSDDEYKSNTSQSAFVQFNTGSTTHTSVSNIPSEVAKESFNTVLPNTQNQQMIPPTIFRPPTISEPNKVPPPMIFNPSNITLTPKQPVINISSANEPQNQIVHLNPSQQTIHQEPNLTSNISQPIAEMPKPLPEPPKLSGTLNYRMAKRKPQYYSGPIEGVGAISNNIKPTIPVFEPTSFQGAVLTPEVYQQSINPTVTASFDISQHTVASPIYHDDTNQTQIQSSPQAYTQFDLSREITDKFEPPKQEPKGFGIIGSLKSKLGSLDINKIQHSVTTFFDPAYNDSKTESQQEPDKYGQNSYSYGFNQNQESNLQIYVPGPNQNPEGYSQSYAQYDQQPSYNFEQNQYYQNQFYGSRVQISDTESLFSTYDNNMISQNVDNLNSQVPYSTYSEPSQYMQFESDTFTPYMPAETSLSSSSIVHKQSSPKKDASEQVIDDVHNTEMTTAIHYKDDIVSDQNKEYSPFENIATSINLRDLSTSALASSAVNFFDNESFNVSLEINKKIENLNINDSTTSACTDTHKHDIDGLTKGESDVDNGQGSLTISTQDVPSKIQNNLSCDHNTIEYDYTQHGDLQDPLNDSANVEAVTDTSKNLFDGNEPHRHICATSILGEKINELENEMRNITLLALSEPDMELNTNKNFEVLEDLLEYSNTLTEKSQSSSELNICETCREVNKPGEGEKEVDDLTAQLIENITSPIQLSNPVVALLTDSRTPVDDTSDLDSRQCAEISHMTEETIEIIHAKTATELLDNVDIEPINNPDVLNYGWSTEKTPFSQPEEPSEHNYAFEIDTEALGFYSNNSLFFDNIPNNASDEIKAEFKNTHEDSPGAVLLVTNIPLAPSVDEDDNKSDGTGGLDVQSIEQDAKKDFPIYDEFVIEPSETDDDKIEYIERERNSEDPIQDIDTFTNRVERFKLMEELVDKKEDKIEVSKNSIFGLPTASTGISFASYFDTGNYAAETHYRNSLSSPTLPFEAGSPSMPFRIPPGFEEEYKRKLGMMSLQNTLNQSDDLDKNIVCIPDTTTQTHHTIVTTYSHISNMSKEITNTSNMSEEVMVHSSIKTNPIAKDPPTTTNIPQLLQIPAVITDRDVTYTEVTLTSSLFDASTQNPKPVAEVETEISKMLPRTLPVQATLFSSKQEKPPEDPDNNISFNRLASYFAAPAKTEPGKSFFELSQSQNHHRHAQTISNIDSGFTTSNTLACQNIDQSRLQNIPTDVYFANLKLITDLTSSQNISYSPNDVVKTVHYFTVQYDNNVEIENSAFKIDSKQLQNESDSSVLELDENATDEDANVQMIVSECELCCNNNINYSDNALRKFDNRNITLNTVKVNSGYKVKKAMDSNNSDNTTDAKRVPDVDQKSSNKQKDAIVSLEDHLQEGSDGVAAMTENRHTTEYMPVRHHWFYAVDVDGKTIWRGFSATDNKVLEEAYLSEDLNEGTTVPTDGGRFDVNVVDRTRKCVYWSEKPTAVKRCSWFYKGTTDARYVPYDESVADKLEEEYRIGVTTGVWHRRLELSGGELVVLHGPAVMVHLARPPDTLAAQPQSTIRPRVVRRGCDEGEIEDSEPSGIDHLLLLCHGVGSACDMRFRSVEEVVDDFRTTSFQLVQGHYKNSYDSGVVNRVEVLPISWHATLHSGETGVDKRLSEITLDSIPRLRNFTNDTVLDVLFYTSPVFCQTIIDTVCAELNRIYGLFMARNPQFTGKVSLGGHSLGSVILYDLLCHQTPENTSATMKCYVEGGAGTGQCTVRYPPLAFKPHALYALGSPIAMFECIRGVKSLGTDFCLPTCEKFFNIFHPYDPIAYRIEPLISSQLGRLKPFLIPHHKGRKRMHLELKDTMARVGADLKQKLIESLRYTWTSMWKTQPPPNDGQLEKVVEEEMEKEQLCVENKEDGTQDSDLATPELLGKLNSGRRVDYVLQEAPFEMINEYLFAMRSHVCYWESEDTMLLILREIYDSLGVPPDCSLPQHTLTVHRTRIANESNAEETSDFPSTSRDGP